MSFSPTPSDKKVTVRAGCEFPLNPMLLEAGLPSSDTSCSRATRLLLKMAATLGFGHMVLVLLAHIIRELRDHGGMHLDHGAMFPNVWQDLGVSGA